MIRFRKPKTKYLLSFVLGMFLFLGLSVTAEAYVGGIDGTVYMNYKGNNIRLPYVKIYREDGNYDYLSLTERISCQEHVRNHQMSTYEWNTFKYNCSRDIPQTYIDPANRPNTRYYDSDDCRMMCKHQSCLYQKSPGVWACDHTGTKVNSSCKTKCSESGARCAQFISPPDTKPARPTEATIQDAIKLVCRADRGGVESTATSAGYYSMAASVNPPINNPAPLDPNVKQLWGSALCPSGTLGNVSLRGGDWTRLNYCGLNCLENKHRIKAYLTKQTFDWLQANYPSIPIDRNDLKGGGSWKLRQTGGYYYRTHLENQQYYVAFSNATGSSNWDGYAPSEYYNLLIGNHQIVNGFHFYWVPPSEPNPPNITKIPKNPTPWIGTATESDNGPACTDSNPYTFNLQATDPDGSKDINRIEFSLAGTGQLGYGDVKWWPLRIMFAQKWPDTTDNMFFVRDKVVKTKGTEYCFDKDRNRVVMKGKADVYCFGVDSHNKQQAKKTSGTVNGKSVDVFYLENDILVYNDGYSFKLLGSKNSGGWQGNTYIAYQKGGKIVDAQFRIQFEGDQSDPWTGEYHNMWRIEDMSAAEDDTYEIPGESKHRTDPTNHHKLSMTRLDFKPPVVNIATPVPLSGNKLQVPWTASDAGGSLLGTVWGEANHSDGKDASSIKNDTRGVSYKPWIDSDGGDYNGNKFLPKYLWEVTNINKANQSTVNETIDLMDNNSGTITFLGGAVDNACNLSDNPGSAQHVSFAPWLLTRAGFVYSNAEMDLEVPNVSGNQNLCPGGGGCPSFNFYPFNLPRYEVALSTELLESGTAFLPENLVNQSSAKFYSIGNYNEANNRLWFNELYKRAEDNLGKYPEKFKHLTGVGSLSGSIRATRCSDTSKLCVLETGNGTTININSNVVCDVETIMFIRGDLNINRPIKTSGAKNGCIFITTGDVNINTQTSADITTEYAKYDYIEVYVVSDGQIQVEDSSKGYGLQVWGGLLGFGQNGGESFDLMRSLKKGKNADYPTYMLHHDPRYYNIARKLLAPDREGYKQEVGDKP